MVRTNSLRHGEALVGDRLPQEMVDRLGLAPGDRVLAIETEQRILVTPYDDELRADLTATRCAARRYRAALCELAT